MDASHIPELEDDQSIPPRPEEEIADVARATPDVEDHSRAQREAAVYRAPMRSRDDEVPVGLAVARALAIGVCGIGGPLNSPPGSLEEAIVRQEQARGARFARRLERFAAAPVRAFVWTRDDDGMLWLGRIVGDWRYDASAEAAAVDLVHVRDCDWLAAPVPSGEAPPDVRATFARGGRNWQRIRPPDAFPLTAAIWDAHRTAHSRDEA